MTLRLVKPDEKVERSFRVRGETVQVVATVKPSESSDNVLYWEYVQNFQDCPKEAILLAAAKLFHITRQRQFRETVNKEGATLSKEMANKEWDIFFIKRHLEQERKGATPAQRANAALGKMSKTELEEMVARATAMLKEAK